MCILISSIPNIFLIILLKHYVTNSNNLVDVIKNCFYKLFSFLYYKKIKFEKYTNITYIDYHIVKKLKEQGNVVDDKGMVILPFYSSIIKNLTQEA